MADEDEIVVDPILCSAREGDPAAFGQLLNDYSPRLLGRIRQLLGPSARARAESGDFLQGVFVEALGAYEKHGLHSQGDFLRWLTAIARNNIRDVVKRPRQEAVSNLSIELLGPSSQGERDPASAAAIAEAEMRLLDALELLSEDRREVVELRSLEGLGHAEVATRMGRTMDAVRMLHTRALMDLGRILRH